MSSSFWNVETYGAASDNTKRRLYFSEFFRMKDESKYILTDSLCLKRDGTI